MKQCKRCNKEMPTNIVINATPLLLSAYYVWRDGNREDNICFDCYCEEIR